ncbi:MAG: hypothetical protein R3C39_15450 [Dehalococcoidia bacterium]
MNRTLSAEGASTLVEAVRERRSLLVAAVPRMAGKSTVLRAALDAGGASVHELSREQPDLGIPPAVDDSYLLVSEFAPTPFADYLWGDDLRRVFDAVETGFPLGATLHAPDAANAFGILGQWNGVPDAQASKIGLFVQIRVLGPWWDPERRVVASIERVDGVSGGRPATTALHRWIEAEDRFEAL